MSTIPTPTKPLQIEEYRPVLGASLIVATVVAVLGWVAYIIVSVADADQAPNLPDAVVYLIGRVAETAMIIAVILLCTYLLSRTSARNTRAALSDLKSDTGEIPRVVEMVRQPHYVVVRQDRDGRQKIDRDDAMRLVAEAREHERQAAATKPAGPYPYGLYSEILADVLEDLGGVGRDVEGDEGEPSPR